MVQDQLVEYISSQLKLGISRDTVKSALTGVGWAPLDVEDTLKKVEGGTTSTPAQTVAPQRTADATGGAAASSKVVSFSTPGTVMGQVKNPEPQTIRVSDLVSGVASASSMPAQSAPKIISSGAPGAARTASATKDQLIKGSSMGSFVAPGQKRSKIGLLEIIAIVLIVALGAFAGYLFFQNSSMSTELQAAQSTQQNQGAAQSSAMQTQIQALNASNTALALEVASFTAMTQSLMTSLSFLAVPTDLPLPATSTPVTVSGTLAAGLGKNTYVVITAYGVKAYVKNSSDSGVAAALQSLLGTTVQISGTYIPGTPNILVTSVNGTPIAMPAMATTTATTSAPH